MSNQMNPQWPFSLYFHHHHTERFKKFATTLLPLIKSLISRPLPAFLFPQGSPTWGHPSSSAWKQVRTVWSSDWRVTWSKQPWFQNVGQMWWMRFILKVHQLVSEEEELLLDFYQHVGDAERKSSCHVDQDEWIHTRKQHTAQPWNDATQTTKQTNKQK